MLHEREIVTSRVSVWRFFSRHGLGFKKILHASEPGARMWSRRGSVGERISPHLTRRGRRLVGRVPHGYRKITTFVAIASGRP